MSSRPPINEKERRTPLIPSSPRHNSTAPYRNYGFPMPESQLSRDNIFATSTSQSTSTTDDLGLLSDTLARLDAEIERDIEQGFAKKETAPSNLDLLQGAMQRIAQLEAQVKEANKRAILAESNVRLTDNLDQTELEYENRHLRRQVQEMETFLADYGLIWVGTNEDDETESVDSEIDAQINWTKIIENLHELNELADSEETSAESVDKFGRLVRRENTPTIKITIYQDGVLLGQGPFRPLDQCTLLIQDLLDGFFPSELQTRYPNGVKFEIEDSSTGPFNRMFPGIGKRINDQPLVLDYRDPSVIRTQDLLEMIPSNDCDVDSTPAERLKSGRPSTSRVKSSGPMATLRVKTCEGTNHIIKMRYEDSVTTLRSYLQSIVKTDDYNIMSYDSNDGWKVIQNEDLTLLELKLTPRAALQLSKRTSPTKSQLISSSIRDLKTV